MLMLLRVRGNCDGNCKVKPFKYLFAITKETIYDVVCSVP